MIEITNTRSNSINKICYDEDNSCLHITFASGGTYKYSDVKKEDFDKLINSESMGKHFHANIKEKFKFEKV